MKCTQTFLVSKLLHKHKRMLRKLEKKDKYLFFSRKIKQNMILYFFYAIFFLYSQLKFVCIVFFCIEQDLSNSLKRALFHILCIHFPENKIQTNSTNYYAGYLFRIESENIINSFATPNCKWTVDQEDPYSQIPSPKS